MNAYHALELLLVGAAVGFSGLRVWQRYIRRTPATASPAAPATGGCKGCGGDKACARSG